MRDGWDGWVTMRERIRYPGGPGEIEGPERTYPGKV
jgi:hypothetical protein